MRRESSALSPSFVALVCSGVLFGGVAGAQKSVSDAQVESNVLRAFANAPELADQTISTKTVFGTVTLSGSVASEDLRSRAETLASTTAGVKKVVDELTLSDGAASEPSNPNPGRVLLSDGTYAPSAGTPSVTTPPVAGTLPADPAVTYQRNDPENDQALDAQTERQSQAGAAPDDAGGTVRRPLSNQPYSQGQSASERYPQEYPQPNYPPQVYPQQTYPPRNLPPPSYAGPAYGRPMDGDQVAGQSVTIPSGTLVRVRIEQRLGSDQSLPGDSFQAIVVHDVVASSAIAIPRGASVLGRVLESKASGALQGRGELTLELTQVILAGRSYPIVSDQWVHNGADKTIQTVNRTAGLGALGAVVGAVAGGGEGAAIGAGVGAAAGLGSSAASGRGQVVIPPESVLTFHLVQPASVRTVSEQELQRLAYGTYAPVQRYARPRFYPNPYSPPPSVYGYPY